ncbi:MAG: hypothetical protein ACJ77C_10010 [Chloroflexota bacterium]
MPTLTLPVLKKVERPAITLSDIELPKIDMPKVDVGDAVASAATAVGLMKKRRSRLPFVVGLGIVVALVGWAWMNYEMLRERASDVASKVGDRMGMIRSGTDEEVAFPSARVAPSTTDYPEGFGATDMASTTGEDANTFDTVSARS